MDIFTVRFCILQIAGAIYWSLAFFNLVKKFKFPKVCASRVDWIKEEENNYKQILHFPRGSILTAGKSEIFKWNEYFSITMHAFSRVVSLQPNTLWKEKEVLNLRLLLSVCIYCLVFCVLDIHWDVVSPDVFLLCTSSVFWYFVGK